MDFTVVIVCHNEAHSVEQTIVHILQQDYPRDRFEVLAVVNKSNDGTEELVDKYPIRRIFFKENYYASAIRNVALNEARGEIVFFLDGHMLLEPDGLRRAAEWFKRKEVVALCGTYYTPYENLEAIRDIRYKAKSRKYSVGMPIEVTLTNFYTLTGGICAFRRQEVLDVGGFDVTFYRDACEDVYVELKLLNKGFTIIYDPKIVALHNHRHANLRSFMIRAARWEPVGLFKLIQRGVVENFKVPYDNYILRIPVTTFLFFTTPFLLLARLDFWPVVALAVMFQMVEVRRFFMVTDRPFKYRVYAMLYWLLINLTRLIWMPVSLVRNLVEYDTHFYLEGERREVDGTLHSLKHDVHIRRPFKSTFRVVLGTARAFLRLGYEAVRHSGKWVREL